jgi:hypothetical protein
LDDLTARAEVHGYNGHARRIRFCQHKSESLRNGVQVKERPGTREQLIFALHIDWSDVADRLIKVRLDLLPEVCFILDNAGDEQWQAAQMSNLNRQEDPLVEINEAEEDEINIAAFI